MAPGVVGSMRAVLLFLALAGARLLGAAPDSIAGMVYREAGGIGGLRDKWELSISFGADGRYRFIKYAAGSTLMVNNSILLLNPPADGTYTYDRTSATAAAITLNEPGGTLFSPPPGSAAKATSVVLHLNFLTAATGSSDYGSFALVDAAANQSAPAVNVSLRGAVAPGRSLIAGFVIPGSGFAMKDSRDLLIRVVGPTLQQFGVASAWATPDFQIYNGAQLAPIGAYNGNRSQPGFTVPLIDPIALGKIFTTAGAFPFPAGSKDAVSVVRLPPGAYTVVASPAAGDPGGEALIEVYFLP
jgi:hypothetical protein